MKSNLFVITTVVLLAGCSAAIPTLHPMMMGVAPTSLSMFLPTIPGATNPDVTQANIHRTICVSGWTARPNFRPPVSYTNALKAQQMKALGLTGRLSSFEEDHLKPLELGGNPTSPLNLWPQPWAGKYNAHMKDHLENLLKRMVCNGTIPLVTAQNEIASNWITSYQKRIENKPLP